MEIAVYGMGCVSCKKLYDNAVKAAESLGGNITVKKVEDIDAIMRAQVLTFPGLAIDGTIMAAGRVLTVDQIIQLIKEKK